MTAALDEGEPMASFPPFERISQKLNRLGISTLALGCLLGCTAPSKEGEAASTATPVVTPAAKSVGPASSATTVTATSAPSAPPQELPPVTAVYPWGPASKERLDGRFPTPEGFKRVAVEKGSFAEFLRTLPLLPDGAPVVDYRGNKLHNDGHHPNIAAVADLDVGTKDLQHCADAIIRLHAEYKYGVGERDLKYKAVSGVSMGYKGYVAGDRAVPVGSNIEMKRVAGAKKDDHALLRAWLDDVFAYAGTQSVERDGAKVDKADMRAGDFFVLSGSPFGHAVLILDVAKDEKGRVALLLGQSYMPAQSFQILRPNESSAWFIVEPNAYAVATPFWKPFPLSSLRRL